MQFRKAMGRALTRFADIASRGRLTLLEALLTKVLATNFRHSKTVLKVLKTLWALGNHLQGITEQLT